MNPKFRGIAKILFFIAVALYPAVVFYFLVLRKAPLRQFSIVVMAFALLAFIVGTSKKEGKTKGIPLFWNFLLLFALGALCLIANSSIILKFYPLLMSLLFLAAFGYTLFFPPNMIFRFAAMQDKSIKGSVNEQRINAYCRKVTLVWCSFFILNGGIAAWTIFSGSDVLWSVYNGGVSYILTGVLFAGEFIVRKKVQKNMPKPVEGEKCGAFDKIDNEKLIEKTENSLRVEFSIPGTSPYFDGHFPEFPILPAVAQTDLVTRFAAKYLGTGIELSQIRRIKFSSLIRPCAPLLLDLKKNEAAISFTISSPDGEVVYSLGSVKLMGESQ
ncbi:MAG: hypothetical protein LBG95_02735 [Treponema sp.]|jgi:uncharacterized membrane protein|nr:hypothetical protein [Treponema sp.]